MFFYLCHYANKPELLTSIARELSLQRQYIQTAKPSNARMTLADLYGGVQVNVHFKDKPDWIIALPLGLTAPQMAALPIWKAISRAKSMPKKFNPTWLELPAVVQAGDHITGE